MNTIRTRPSFAKWIRLPAAVFLATALACTLSGPTPPSPSVFDSGRTAFGFFPTPPEVSIDSVLATFRAIGEHGDVILIQQNVPWEDLRENWGAESRTVTDIRNQVDLAWQNGLEAIFVVDPLNGLNRKKFGNLPASWTDANFANPAIRSAYRNFAVRLADEFHPRYLGLASEINTYANAYPADFPNFLSLYRETYRAVKEISPQTRAFVTFQWDEVNNFGKPGADGAPRLNWDSIEVFEPDLDLWVISSYPFAAFPSAADIPADYYTPLLDRTDKPLAVAEGGYNSADIQGVRGSPADQVRYLSAIHSQIGPRLQFWIYLLLDDFNMDSYGAEFTRQGHAADVETLRFFSLLGLRERDGKPKPALSTWDSYRQ